MAEQDIPSFGFDISGAQDRARQLRDNPVAAFPQFQRPQVQDRDVILSALMGLGAGSQAAQNAARLGDPLGAVLAGFAGAAGNVAQNNPQNIAEQRAAQEAQRQLQALQMIPVDQVSPALIQAHPELKGLPLGIVHQIAPLIEKSQAFADSHYNLDQAAALMAPSGKPEDIAAMKEKLKPLYPKGFLPKDVAHLGAQNQRALEQHDFMQKEHERQQKFQDEQRQERQNERRQNKTLELVEKFNADPSVKKAQMSVDAAHTIRGLLESDNPIAANAVPTFMARASGEVGNLSEADKRPFGGSQAILDRFQAALKQAQSGKMTPENKKFVSDLVATMEQRAQQNMDSIARQRSRQYAKAVDYLKADEVYGALRPGADAGMAAAPVYKRTATNAQGLKIGLNAATGKWEPVR